MTKKVKPAKKAKKPADKTPEITKAAKALENYLKENNLDPAKDWSKDKTHGKAVKELMAKLNKERDKVAAQYPEKDTANQKKLVKQMFEGGVSATVQLEDWKKSLEIKELDRTLLALTVDKIYIYENKQIKIHIRYQDMIEKMKVIRRFYAEHRTECRKEVE